MSTATPDDPLPDTAHDEPSPGAGGRVVLAATALAVIVLVAVVIVVGRSAATDASMRTDGLATGAAVSALGTSAPTTSPPATLPPLPLPDPLPDDPYAPTPQVVVGRISIPKLGVEADLQQGMTLTAINRGPGHWPGTAEPGQLGNMVIAGHRTTYSKPFNRLDELAAGDLVVFTTDAGTFTYAVRGTIIVPANHVGIAAQSYAHTATLFACHPKGSAAQRIVTKLRLLDAAGQPVDPDSALPPIEQGTDPETDTTLLVKGEQSELPADPLILSNG